MNLLKHRSVNLLKHTLVNFLKHKPVNLQVSVETREMPTWHFDCCHPRQVSAGGLTNHLFTLTSSRPVTWHSTFAGCAVTRVQLHTGSRNYTQVYTFSLTFFYLDRVLLRGIPLDFSIIQAFVTNENITERGIHFPSVDVDFDFCWDTTCGSVGTMWDSSAEFGSYNVSRGELVGRMWEGEW